MEEQEFNLCELLKGHEKEKFYCSLIGDSVIFLIRTKEIMANCEINDCGFSKDHLQLQCIDGKSSFLIQIE